MSGAERRRRKDQRRLARLAVLEMSSFLDEVNDRVVDFHRIAARRASALRTSDGRRVTPSSEISEQVRAFERDLVAALDVLHEVFVGRSRTPDCLGLTQAEFGEYKAQGLSAVRDLQSLLDRGSVAPEVDDTAARSMAAAAGLPFHRLVSGRYRGGAARRFAGASSNAREARMND